MTGMVLGIRIENHTPFDFGGSRAALSNRVRKWLNEIQKRTLMGMAEQYHQDLMPKHFRAGAQSEYGYEERTEFYDKEIKPKQGVAGGKNPNISLNLKGESMRAILYGPLKLSGNHNVVTSQTANPPSYFTNPFIGVIGTKKDGTAKIITRQPDKVDEVKRISNADQRILRRFAADKLKPALQAVNRKIKTQVKQFK